MISEPESAYHPPQTKPPESYCRYMNPNGVRCNVRIPADQRFCKEHGGK